RVLPHEAVLRQEPSASRFRRGRLRATCPALAATAEHEPFSGRRPFDWYPFDRRARRDHLDAVELREDAKRRLLGASGGETLGDRDEQVRETGEDPERGERLDEEVARAAAPDAGDGERRGACRETASCGREPDE